MLSQNNEIIFFLTIHVTNGLPYIFTCLPIFLSQGKKSQIRVRYHNWSRTNVSNQTYIRKKEKCCCIHVQVNSDYKNCCSHSPLFTYMLSYLNCFLRHCNKYSNKTCMRNVVHMLYLPPDHGSLKTTRTGLSCPAQVKVHK